MIFIDSLPFAIDDYFIESKCAKHRRQAVLEPQSGVIVVLLVFNHRQVAHVAVVAVTLNRYQTPGAPVEKTGKWQDHAQRAKGHLQTDYEPLSRRK